MPDNNPDTNNESIPQSQRAKVIAGTEGINYDSVSEIQGNRFKNFVFHHKVLIFVLVLFIILASFSLWNFFFTGGEKDLGIIYAGPCNMYDSGVKIASAIKQIRTDKDGLAVSISDIEWYSEQYLVDNELKADGYLNQAGLDEFQREMTDGDVLVLFLCPELYKQLKPSLIPMSEIFDDVPYSTYDGHAIELWLTDFYEYFTAVQDMPEDTLICVRRASTVKAYNEKTAPEAEEKAKQLVRDIVNFVNPNPEESEG